MNIYIANLGFNVGNEDLRSLFTNYGAIISAKVIIDKITNQSRGFGFVEMADEEAGQKAIKEMNGVMVDGRPIKVSEARPKDDRNGGSYNPNRR
jgi:RNA recognition motif-containing protein